MANHQDNYTSNFEGQDPAGNAGLFLFLNTHEHQYHPSGSDTVVHIPVPEKIDVSSANLHTTIRHILNEQGDPVLIDGNKEYRFAVRGTDEYVFACVTGESYAECLIVNRNTGVVSTKFINMDSIVYVQRSADNIFSTIANIIIGGRMPVITDSGIAFYLASISGNSIRFVRTDTGTGDVHVLNIVPDNTITETTLQTNEILRIIVTDPVTSGLTQEEYAVISQYKTVILAYGSGSSQSYAYQISIGSNTWFIHQNENGYDLFKVSPTPSDPDDPASRHAITKTSYTYGSSAMTMRNFAASDASDTVNSHLAFQLANDEMWVMEDWDGGWTAQLAFIAPTDADNNCVVRFENATFNTTYYPTGYPIEIWNHSKDAQLTPLNGSITAMQKDCSYEIRIYGDKYYCCEVWNAQNAPVTDAELQHAIDTLRSRTVFVIDVGEISGQVNLNPNGTTGFLGTLFSPYMDFDLSTDTSVVFDVEQMGNQGNMTNFVIVIYEFDATTGEFNWVANTDDLTTSLDSADRRLGLHHAKLQHLKQDAQLLGGKLYYAVACGHWNGWAFAGNTFATTLHASVTPAFQCDNRSATVDPATLGTGSYAKLYATDQSDPTKVDYSGISGNRMFVAFTNSTLSI